MRRSNLACLAGVAAFALAPASSAVAAGEPFAHGDPVAGKI